MKQEKSKYLEYFISAFAIYTICAYMIGFIRDYFFNETNHLSWTIWIFGLIYSGIFSYWHFRCIGSIHGSKKLLFFKNVSLAISVFHLIIYNLNPNQKVYFILFLIFIGFSAYCNQRYVYPEKKSLWILILTLFAIILFIHTS